MESLSTAEIMDHAGMLDILVFTYPQTIVYASTPNFLLQARLVPILAR
jgi:hypothetical protein